MSPMTRKARRSASRIGPLGVADRPARARAGEPSRRDTYGRERPPPAGGWCATPGATPGATPTPSADRSSGQKWGVAPVQSLPAGASRVVRSRTKNPNGDSDKWTRGVPHHPLSYCHTPPCVRVAFRLPCALPCALPRNGTETRGTIRSPPRGQSAARLTKSGSGQSPPAPSLWWACLREVAAVL